MTTIESATDHAYYRQLALLPDVLRRFAFGDGATSVRRFVATLSDEEVWATAEVGLTLDQPSDARRASDFMWDYMATPDRYALADALQSAAYAEIERRP